jgi:hypothetical protein
MSERQDRPLKTAPEQGAAMFNIDALIGKEVYWKQYGYGVRQGTILGGFIAPDGEQTAGCLSLVIDILGVGLEVAHLPFRDDINVDGGCRIKLVKEGEPPHFD